MNNDTHPPEANEIWPPEDIAAYHMTQGGWVPGNSAAAQEAAKKADPVWVLAALRTEATAGNADGIKADYAAVACSPAYREARREYTQHIDAIVEAAIQETGHKLKDPTSKRTAALYEAVVLILQAGTGLDPWDAVTQYTDRQCKRATGGDKVRRRSDGRALLRWKAAWIAAHPEDWDEFANRPVRKATVDLEELRKITGSVDTGRR